jgi:hypothetical protein
VEEARVSTLTFDATAFAVATLKQNTNLSRHMVTTTLGGNANGQSEALYTLGGRSFSICSSDGALAFDSGSDFKRITAAAEPEGIALGEGRPERSAMALRRE